jgi:hypothetical protein
VASILNFVWQIVLAVFYYFNFSPHIGHFRVRHYGGIDKNTGKSKFYYHQQSKDYAVSQMASPVNGNSINGKTVTNQNEIVHSTIEQLTTVEQSNLKDLSHNQGGRSLVWLGHQLPKLTTRVQIPATAPSANQSTLKFTLPFSL